MTTNTPDDFNASMIRRLNDVSTQLKPLLRERDAERRAKSISDADWSSMQILGHLVEMVPFWLNQAQILIAEPLTIEPLKFGRSIDSPERLAGPEQGAHGDLDDLLAQWDASIASASQVIITLTPEQRAKKGTHIRRGEMTAGDVIQFFIVDHAEEHLAQIQNT